jgi:hypothetical protein
MTDRFLVVCDYGQGGVWAYVLAPSRAEIVERYPELVVVDEPPAWMNEERHARLMESVEDVDAPGEFLTAVIADRDLE